jgi:hypothetical protein
MSRFRSMAALAGVLLCNTATPTPVNATSTPNSIVAPASLTPQPKATSPASSQLVLTHRTRYRICGGGNFDGDEQMRHGPRQKRSAKQRNKAYAKRR